MSAKANSRVSDGTTLELPSAREILISRVFNAKASIVFEAVTKPEHIRRWWAPRSRGEMLTCEVDFEVGGKWRYTMRASSGFEIGFSGTFLEIQAPTKMVRTEIFDPFPDSVSTGTMLLVESGGQTKMTIRTVYPSQVVRDQVIASGMEDGMRESYRQLTEIIAELG